jgi:hypothetical protein
MTQNLFEIIDSVDFEEYGSLFLTRVAWTQDRLDLFLELKDDYRPNLHPNWRVACSSVREERLSLGAHDELNLTFDHVLLWPHTASHTRVSFYGKSKDPSAVVGALYERHVSLVGHWMPFHRFLNGAPTVTDLIAGGYGMLAEGPEPLLLAYEEVMQQHGISASHHEPEPPAYCDGENWAEQTSSLAALVIGESYVVAADFRAETV